MDDFEWMSYCYDFLINNYMIRYTTYRNGMLFLAFTLLKKNEVRGGVITTLTF